MACRICQQPVALDVCDDCANRNGIVAMPPPRRPRAPCRACKGTRLTRAIPRELSIDTHRGEANVARHAPMFVTYQPHIAAKFWSAGVKSTELDPLHGHGMLEMYVCDGCGYVEWYAHGPIPIGPEYMTESIDVGGPPHR